jgi:archaetidylinositol phosphate synthase
MSQDTLIHRIVRPAVRALAPTRIRPNHITTLRLLTGVAAALAFARGGTLWPAIGGAVFVFSMLLDRADGELARLTGRSSPGGHNYDLVSDCASNVVAFIGIGVGQMPVLGALGPLLGLLAGVGIGALFWQLNVLKLAEIPRYSFWDDRFAADPDDAMVFVPVLIWCGAAVPMLFAAAVITPSAALWLGRPGARSTG